jgi:hypothetical protein
MARTLVSQAEYARRRGVSKQAVNQRTEPHGGPIPVYGVKKQIDLDEADRLWTATMRPREQAKSTAHVPEQVPEYDASGIASLEARKAVSEALAEDPVAGHAAKALAPATQAKIASAIIRAQTEKIKLEKMKGGLIEKGEALRQAFSFCRHMRDAWLNWPASVAPVLAAELGADPHQTLIAPERIVREHLNELSERQFDL